MNGQRILVNCPELKNRQRIRMIGALFTILAMHLDVQMRQTSRSGIAGYGRFVLVGGTPSPSSAQASEPSLSANCRKLAPSDALPLHTRPSLLGSHCGPPATRFPENAVLFSRYRFKLCDRRLDLILKSRPSIVSAVQEGSPSCPIPQLLFR